MHRKTRSSNTSVNALYSLGNHSRPRTTARPSANSGYSRRPSFSLRKIVQYHAPRNAHANRRPSHAVVNANRRPSNASTNANRRPSNASTNANRRPSNASAYANRRPSVSSVATSMATTTAAAHLYPRSEPYEPYEPYEPHDPEQFYARDTIEYNHPPVQPILSHVTGLTYPLSVFNYSPNSREHQRRKALKDAVVSMDSQVVITQLEQMYQGLTSSKAHLATPLEDDIRWVQKQWMTSQTRQTRATQREHSRHKLIDRMEYRSRHRKTHRMF